GGGARRPPRRVVPPRRRVRRDGRRRADRRLLRGARALRPADSAPLEGADNLAQLSGTVRTRRGTTHVVRRVTLSPPATDGPWPPSPEEVETAVRAYEVM